MILILAMFAVLAPGAESLETVLTKMDAAGQSFKGMAAQVSYLKFTDVVKDKSVESGGIFMQKSGNEYKVLITFRDPEKKTVLFAKGKAQIYHERTNVLEEYSLGDQKGVVDQFFQLGFGGGGHSLTKSYDVKVDGDETVSRVPTVKLTLIPTGKLKDITKIELWISKDKWTPVQQRFTELSKDYTEVTYQNVEEGPQSDKLFMIKTDGKTKKVYPGK